MGGFLAVAIVSTALSGFSPQFSPGGYNVQMLEFLQLGPLLWLLTLLPRIARSQVVKGMAGLLVANSIPLAYGIAENGFSSALRDFAGVYYMTMLIFGYALGRYRVITSTNALVGLTFAALVFIAGWVLGIADGVILYEVLAFNFRTPALACFCAAMLCLAGLGQPAGWRRGVIIAGGLLYAVFVLQLRTRAAYLGLAVGAAVVLVYAISFYAREPRQMGRVVGRILAVTLATTVLSLWFSDEVGGLLSNAIQRSEIVASSTYYADVTVAFRLEAWRQAWQDFLDSPVVGVGFGKYMILDPWLRQEYALYPSHMIHNGVLQILYSGGAIAMAGTIYFWWRVRNALRHSRAAFVGLPVLAITLSYVAYTAFGAILFKAVEAIPLWLIVGLAIGEAETQSQPIVDPLRRPDQFSRVR